MIGYRICEGDLEGVLDVQQLKYCDHLISDIYKRAVGEVDFSQKQTDNVNTESITV